MNTQVKTIEHAEVLPSIELTPMGMLDRAVASGASVDVIEKLMALQERWEANQARKLFNSAIVAAKANIPVIEKNRHVGFDSKTPGKARTDYWHEDLAEIERTVRPHLSENGMDYRFETSSKPNEPVSVTCVLFHQAGHEVRNTLSGPADSSGNKNPLQAISSTVTMLQRYTLKAALGLAAGKDDDGKASGGVPDLITDAQRETLGKLIDETGADLDKFLQYFNLEYLADLPAKRFADAVVALQKVAENRKAKQAAPAGAK